MEGREGEGRELPGVSPKATYGLTKLWLWEETISARMSARASVPLMPLHLCVCALWQMSSRPHDFEVCGFFFHFFSFFFCPWTSALLLAVTLRFRLYFLPYHWWGMCCCLTIPYYFYISCSRTAAATEAAISCSGSSVLCWFYLATWWILRGEDKV